MNKRYQKGSQNKAPSVVPGKKRRMKKALVIIFSLFVALAVICLVLFAVESALQKSREDYPSDTGKAPTLSGKYTLNFYEPDYDTDILTDSDYLAKDRSVHYYLPSDSGSIGIILDEYDARELTEGQRFFIQYFETLVMGDYERYRTFFTKDYTENPIGFEKFPLERKFPMQRIYDISVTELGRSTPGDASYSYNGQPAVFGVYDVRYKILKNDGELRHDLPENGEQPLVFELVTIHAGTDNEKTSIQNLYRYSDIAIEK